MVPEPAIQKFTGSQKPMEPTTTEPLGLQLQNLVDVACGIIGKPSKGSTAAQRRPPPYLRYVEPKGVILLPLLWLWPCLSSFTFILTFYPWIRLKDKIFYDRRKFHP